MIDMDGEIKDYSLSIGIRGKVLGQDAIASYSLRHGQGCLQGKVILIHESIDEVVALISKELGEQLHDVLPGYLQDISAELSFGSSYDHEFLRMETDGLSVSMLHMTGGGSALLLALPDGQSPKGLGELVEQAKNLLGIHELFFYASRGAALDINRLLNRKNQETVLPPDDFYKTDSYCLYADYQFDKNNCFLDSFLHDLLGIDSMALFAGKNQSQAYLALSVPKLQTAALTVEKLYFQIESGAGLAFCASGRFRFSAVPEMIFGVSCKLSPESILLSASGVTENPINLFGAFYLGSAALTIGYGEGGLIFGLMGELYLRKLYLFAAIQLAIYGEVVKPQLVSFSTGTLSFSSLFENITGLVIPGIEALDIIEIGNFAFRLSVPFSAEDLQKRDISAVVRFFNAHITDQEFALKENSTVIETIKEDPGYSLVDKWRMRHYYIDSSGVLYLRPQFYYSDVDNFTLPDGSVVSAGIFFCANIRIFGINIKTLFSFRREEGVLAFASVSEINLGIVKLTRSDFSRENPIPLPEQSLLYQFMDCCENGVVFYLQASKQDISFYFDGKLSILGGLFEEQAQLYYQNRTVRVSLESHMLGMTTQVSFSADYAHFTSSDFSLYISFDTHLLEEKLKSFSEKLTRAVEVCREKINSARQSLEDAKAKVYKLYDEINTLNRRIDDCRSRLSSMSWFKKIFWAPIIGCEIAGYEIAIGALYASLYIAEAALSVAEAAVSFAGKLSEGVLKVINGVITSVTSLFFIRRLTALIHVGSSRNELAFSAEFVALGKEYSCSWSISRDLAMNAEKGIETISDAFSEKTDKDIQDLQNGAISVSRANSARCCSYREQLYQLDDASLYRLDDALKMLNKNAEMLCFLQEKYVQLFGETVQEFNESELSYLEVLGLIKANSDVAQRAAELDSLQDTVMELKTLASEHKGTLKAAAAEDAVQKYEQARILSEQLGTLKDNLNMTHSDIRSLRISRKQAVHRAMSQRGIYQERYDGTMYEYVKSVIEMTETLYADAPESYTNPYTDAQIQETLLHTEEYFRIND